MDISDNKCIYCEFNVYFFVFLELYIKRKYIKEFVFYCMVCDYYVVIRREMIRYVVIEKYKIKR